MSSPVVVCYLVRSEIRQTISEIRDMMNYLCHILSPLLPCYSPPQPATTLHDAFFRKNDWKCSLEEQKEEEELPRARRRYTSSPRATPAVFVYSPAITPISIFLSYGRQHQAALSLKEESLPELLNFSRFVSGRPLDSTTGTESLSDL